MRPAGFWVRIGARFVDGLLTFAIPGAIYGVSYGAGVGSEDAGAVAAGIAYVAMLLAYPPLMTACNGGRTLGKQLARVRVVNDGGAPTGLGRAVVRESLLKFLFDLLLLPHLVSVIVMHTNPERRTLHDLMAGTRVVRS